MNNKKNEDCKLAEAICLLTNELQNLRTDKHTLILKRIEEMELHLLDAIAKNASVTPSIETAVMMTQKALDRLDASIPDKTKE